MVNSRWSLWHPILLHFSRSESFGSIDANKYLPTCLRINLSVLSVIQSLHLGILIWDRSFELFTAQQA
ncbi:hypothetical protein H9L39_07056 [Fusarium oxysporum f. sp. albedinis]|nr:hypothetical protein H9L39_07056 [Fusarium oxysporum f. sp. albedinis]